MATVMAVNNIQIVPITISTVDPQASLDAELARLSIPREHFIGCEVVALETTNQRAELLVFY